MVRRADGEEYGDYLAEKLVEEAREFRDARTTDGEDPEAELGDVLEVVKTLLDRGDRDRVHRHREGKAAERGAFAEGIVLERVEDGG